MAARSRSAGALAAALVVVLLAQANGRTLQVRSNFKCCRPAVHM